LRGRVETLQLPHSVGEGLNAILLEYVSDLITSG